MIKRRNFFSLCCVLILASWMVTQNVYAQMLKDISAPRDQVEDVEESDVSVEPVEEGPVKVELIGDTIEYARDRNYVIAEGNVVLTRGKTKLMCDRVEFSRENQIAYAEGNVRLYTGQGEILGDDLTFNFETMTGNFHGARLASEPYFGLSQQASKVEGDKLVINEGYITTCDHDKPHYKVASKKIDIYPKDKLVARNVRMFVGDLPLLYLPKFKHRLDDKEPMVVFTPGIDKDWGTFLLSKWRYYINDNWKGNINVDYRTHKDLAWGIDAEYKIPDMGEGAVRTYYMNERNITSKYFWQERPTPTIERERFRVLWRHKWDIDPNTDAILQYARLSDSTILKDYFEDENDEDSDPKTFFLLTHFLPKGTISFRTDARTNRFFSEVERLPEIRYDLADEEIMDTGFYFRNTTTYSNLTNKQASPSEVRLSTTRVDVDSDISYPMKISFLEFRPSVGGRHTYYSKTKNEDSYNSIRGLFRTGASLSTKFYRIFDVYSEGLIELERLRHVITPSVDYSFVAEPTIDSSTFDEFDEIDSQSSSHKMTFALENKLQTKRDGKSIDLLRAILSTDFLLKEDAGGGGFASIATDIDFLPADWLSFYFDSEYDTRRDKLNTANFDIYINGKDEKWSFGFGKRFNTEVDDQIETAFLYKINPKWSFKVLERFDTKSGLQKEQDIVLTRDLHAWTMDLNFNETRGEGSEIVLLFRMKAFPDMGFDVGTSFNKRKPGSQSP